MGFDEYENVMTQTHLRGDPEGDLYKYGLDMLWSWPHSPIIGHVDLIRAGNTDLAWLPRGQVDWRMLAAVGVLVLAAGAMLLGALYRPADARSLTVLGVLCACVTIIVLWRAGAHPLRATYGLDPLEGQAALDAVMARALPDDGVMIIRPLAPAELDRYPRLPSVYGIPDDSLFGAQWNTDLEKLVDNAQVRQRRLWLVVQSEQDSFAARIADRLKPTLRRTSRDAFGKYVVVLFEPR